MRTAEHQSSRLLLRARAGNAGELGLDEATGSTALGVSGLWKPPANGNAGAGRPGGQPQASDTVDAPDGFGGTVPAPLTQSTQSRSRHLPVSVERSGNQRTRSSVVRRYHLPAYGLWVYVSGGGDGLVEPLRPGLGIEQHLGSRFLHSSKR